MIIHFIPYLLTTLFASHSLSRAFLSSTYDDSDHTNPLLSPSTRDSPQRPSNTPSDNSICPSSATEPTYPIMYVGAEATGSFCGTVEFDFDDYGPCYNLYYALDSSTLVSSGMTIKIKYDLFGRDSTTLPVDTNNVFITSYSEGTPSIIQPKETSSGNLFEITTGSLFCSRFEIRLLSTYTFASLFSVNAGGNLTLLSMTIYGSETSCTISEELIYVPSASLFLHCFIREWWSDLL